MREMKDSGYAWLGEIPATWKMQKVKHCFYRKNEKAMQDDPVILSLARSGVRVRDISNNEGQLAASYYNYNPVDFDDLLLNPMDLYSGANCSISKVQGVISPAYINLKALEGINPMFFDYYFKVQYWLKAFFSYGKGVSFDNRWTLNADTLMNYPVVLPSYKEQSMIADFLNEKCRKIELIVEKEQSIVEKLKDLKSTLISETLVKEVHDGQLVPYLDYRSTKLGDCISLLTDYHANGSYEILAKNVTLLDNEGYALMVRTLNLERNDFQDNVIFIDEHAYNFLEKSKVFGGEVIINKIGSAGKVYYMPNLNRPVSLAMNQFMLRFKDGIDSKYIYYFLHTKYAEEQIAQRVKGAVTLTITKNAVRSIPILLPEEKTQHDIVSYLDKKIQAIDKRIRDKEKLISKLDEYKKSLIFEVVTGKKEVL